MGAVLLLAAPACRGRVALAEPGVAPDGIELTAREREVP